MTRARKPKPPTKTAIARDLADRIDAHLKRIENDPKLNPSKHYDKQLKKWTVDKTGMGVRDFFSAYAVGDRHRVCVLYVSYQGNSHITIEEAEAYLAWLDAGNVGRHFEQQHAAKAARE